MTKTAFITGISGQVGSYLAEHLLSLGYSVHGLVRPSVSSSHSNIEHLGSKITLHIGDVTDQVRLTNIMLSISPDEVYNLAAQSHVGRSFECPAHTADVNAIGAYNVMEAAFKSVPRCRLYQASTSEMFGDVECGRQNEDTPFRPVSPYGAAKEYAHRMAQCYRRAGYFATCGILFNNESPRRGAEFVTRKISGGVAAFKRGDIEYFSLGNLDAKRDWGHTVDYVKGIHAMISHNSPDDFVLATGKNYSVREFCERAFWHAGMKLRWWGHGEDERGVVEGRVAVKVDPALYRPTDVGFLCGNAAKAKVLLGWQPLISFDDLVKEMVAAELATNG